MSGSCSRAVLGAARLVRRAALPHDAAIRASAGAAQALAAAPREDPARWSARPTRPRPRGDLEAALRLRFRAGLLRLDARGAIEFRPSISTHEVRRALRSEDFDALAATFDDVVYGGRAAGARGRQGRPRALAAQS